MIIFKYLFFINFLIKFFKIKFHPLPPYLFFLKTFHAKYLNIIDLKHNNRRKAKYNKKNVI